MRYLGCILIISTLLLVLAGFSAVVQHLPKASANVPAESEPWMYCNDDIGSRFVCPNPTNWMVFGIYTSDSGHLMVDSVTCFEYLVVGGGANPVFLRSVNDDCASKRFIFGK